MTEPSDPGPDGPEGVTPNSWPASWPRLYPEGDRDTGVQGPVKGTQRANFVGGSADGLWDQVEEVSPGRLPPDLETMGSVYRLAETAGQEPRYHWHGFQDN